MKHLKMYKHYSATPVVCLENCKINMRVRRGPFWIYGSSDYKDGVPYFGKITKITRDVIQHERWVQVRWENGNVNFYRIGPEYFDLIIADENKVILEII